MHFPVKRNLVLALCLALASCVFDDKEAKRGSVVDNELRTGILFLADGKPAANARVRVFPVNHVPDSSALPKRAVDGPAFSTRTDSKGRYAIDSLLPRGEYNILGELDGEVSFQDSVYFTSNLDSIPADTLEDPGSLAGVVALQPNHDPRTVTVQVLGTNTYANVEEEGAFKLSGLAAGRYRLRVQTTLPEYTVLFASVTIGSGRSDSLPQPLVIPFTGIPVVTGLSAAYDTVNGLVRLSWNPVKFRALSGYLIFREEGSGLNLSLVPIAGTADTAYTDSLFLPYPRGVFNPGDNDLDIHYRVRAKNKSDQVGLSYGAVSLTARSPISAWTWFQFSTPILRWDAARSADKVNMTVTASNSLHRLTRLDWYAGDTGRLVSTRSFTPQSVVRDSGDFAWAEEGAFTLYVKALDETGKAWWDSLRVAGNSAPLISGTPPTKVTAMEYFNFRPTVFDRDGDNLVFSIVNGPRWADVSTGALAGSPRNSDVGKYEGIRIRVSDGRRSTELPAFDLVVEGTPWIPKNFFPTDQGMGIHNASVFVDGVMYSLMGNWNGETELFAFDTLTNTWGNAATSPKNLNKSTLQVINGVLYSFGSEAPVPTDAPTLIQNSSWAFTIATKKWAARAPMPTARARITSSVFGGKIYVFGGKDSSGALSRAVEAYEPGTNTWNRKQPMPWTCPFCRSTVVGGKILVIGDSSDGQGADSKRFLLVKAYDPALDAWTGLSATPTEAYDFALCGVKDRLFLFGGKNAANPFRVEEYNFASNAWKSKQNLPSDFEWGIDGCIEAGSSAFLLTYSSLRPVQFFPGFLK
ncbi:MAG: Kelch repeat-containing protein [Fibrobacteres bacterium]|nr:Kelch repeat-containing protein [Fibrobacterota bacterium]